MTSNDNHLLPPANLWSNFLSGRWNSQRQMMSMMPPNLMFPYLSMNRDLKHFQSETTPNPYSLEAMQIIRTMLQRQSQLPTMQQNLFQRNLYIPPFLTSQKSTETIYSQSPIPNHLPSPAEKSIFLNGEMNNSFENLESKQSDLSNLRCPVCNQVVGEYDLESHLHHELNSLSDVSNKLYPEHQSGSLLYTSPVHHTSEEHNLLPTSDSNTQWKSKLPFQSSISRYRSFEKIKINRYQRKSNNIAHSNILDLKLPIVRENGKKSRNDSCSDFCISSKKVKITNDNVEEVEMD